MLHLFIIFIALFVCTDMASAEALFSRHNSTSPKLLKPSNAYKHSEHCDVKGDITAPSSSTVEGREAIIEDDMESRSQVCMCMCLYGVK